MSITGEPGGAPAKDRQSGFRHQRRQPRRDRHLAAYVHKLKTGRGQVVDTSLMEAGAAADLLARGDLLSDGHLAGSDRAPRTSSARHTRRSTRATAGSPWAEPTRPTGNGIAE